MPSSAPVDAPARPPPHLVGVGEGVGNGKVDLLATEAGDSRMVSDCHSAEPTEGGARTRAEPG